MYNLSGANSFFQCLVSQVQEIVATGGCNKGEISIFLPYISTYSRSLLIWALQLGLYLAPQIG